MPHKYNEKMFDIKHLRETAEKLKNWGRWGPDDEIGTLNFITPDKIIDASKLIKRGWRSIWNSSFFQKQRSNITLVTICSTK